MGFTIEKERIMNLGTCDLFPAGGATPANRPGRPFVNTAC